MTSAIQTILLPVDITHAEDWTFAVDRAVDLTRRYGAKLYVLSVVHIFEHNLNVFPEDHLPELHKFVSDTFPDDIDVEGVQRAGPPHRKILEAADELGVDLIVMGSHNPRLSDSIMGSNAASVALHAKQSVYVVRA